MAKIKNLIKWKLKIPFKYLTKLSQMEGKLVLTYFDGEGRAELSRLILRVGGVKFTDKRVSFPEFG